MLHLEMLPIAIAKLNETVAIYVYKNHLFDCLINGLDLIRSKGIKSYITSK